METFYTITELATTLKVSDKTIRRAIDKGDMKAIWMGVWRISQEQFSEYIEKRTVSKTKRKKLTLA